MSELRKVVAYAFRLHGREAMGRNEFKQLLSFRLTWYKPAEASLLLDRALRAGLLAEDGDRVKLGFRAQDEALPFDFRGSAWALEEPLEGAAAQPPQLPPQGLADPHLVDRARAWRELARGSITDEAARLLALRDRGADVRAEAQQALARMREAAARRAG